MPRRRSQSARVTQAEVARLAGVSQTVVSMVLNGTGIAQRRVGEDARQRVLKAIEMTGYVANPIAQRLAGGRNALIGVYTYEPVFPHRAGDFYQPFLEGVEEEAQRQGVDLVLFTSMSAGRERQLLASGGIHRLRLADGCVLLGRHSHPDDLTALASQDFPFAFIGRRTAPGVSVPYAGADYDTATEKITERLIGLGHRQIAMVTEFTPHESTQDRLRGYRRAMRAAGLLPVVLDEPDPASAELFETIAAHRITALLTTSDLARPIRAAALDRGLGVPGDLSIARLGDPEQRDPGEVSWSGFTIPRQQMGIEALRIVLGQFGDQRDLGATGVVPTPAETATTHPAATAAHTAADLLAQQTLIPCELVDGETIAPPAPGGPSTTTKENPQA